MISNSLVVWENPEPSAAIRISLECKSSRLEYKPSEPMARDTCPFPRGHRIFWNHLVDSNHSQLFLNRLKPLGTVWGPVCITVQCVKHMLSNCSGFEGYIYYKKCTSQ